ncbi:AraC-type DNA-binding protein [Brevibacterium sandarakinum]|uniref:AraC-type DNA-binding protein n=1 Tax=Brevibacterium sandarakinum TaxID=629680 RepID=A0A1H1RTG6_BRESA|nr:AraC family transcriptional regulator [Brevibacterium sandarakinum]SDS39018.1 AraC-type DNA-binding protein [Brevibacterium sandarakinum]
MLAPDDTGPGRLLTCAGGPVFAETTVYRRRREPEAYDWCRLGFIREGTAWLLSTDGSEHVRAGHAIFTGPGVLCGIEPEDVTAMSTVYLQRDYFADLMTWHRPGAVCPWTRESACPDSSVIIRSLHPGAVNIEPWLDELVSLSHQSATTRFYRRQALVSGLLDILIEDHSGPDKHGPWAPVAAHVPGLSRRPVVLREPARQAAYLLESDPARPWSLAELARSVHLSLSQLTRVFAASYELTPITYLGLVRARRFAHLLRTTNLPITTAARQVGWNSRGHAARHFRRYFGTTPSEYRRARLAPTRIAA